MSQGKLHARLLLRLASNPHDLKPADAQPLHLLHKLGLVELSARVTAKGRSIIPDPPSAATSPAPAPLIPEDEERARSVLLRLTYEQRQIFRNVAEVMSRCDRNAPLLDSAPIGDCWESWELETTAADLVHYLADLRVILRLLWDVLETDESWEGQDLGMVSSLDLNMIGALRRLVPWGTSPERWRPFFELWDTLDAEKIPDALAPPEVPGDGVSDEAREALYALASAELESADVVVDSGVPEDVQTIPEAVALELHRKDWIKLTSRSELTTHRKVSMATITADGWEALAIAV